MKNFKIKIALFLCIFVIVVSAIGFSLAAFRIKGGKVGDVTIGTAMATGLRFEGDDQIGGENISPGGTVTKTFRIINDTNSAQSYDLYFSEVINTIKRNNDLVFTLTSTNGGVEMDTSVFPDIDSVIGTSIMIDPHITQEYTLTITYLNSPEIQNGDRGFELNTKIMVENEMPRYNLLANYYDLDSKLLTSGYVLVQPDGIRSDVNSDGTFLIENIPLGNHIIEIYNENNIKIDSGSFKLKRGITESVSNNVIVGAENKTIVILANRTDTKLEINGEADTHSIDIFANNAELSKNLVTVRNNLNSEVITITPTSHYHFSEITCTEGLTYNFNADYTTIRFTNVTTSGSCTIDYSVDNYSVTFLANNGTVSPNIRNVIYNETTTATATPNLGYKFNSVTCTNSLTASHVDGLITTGNVLNSSLCTIDNIKDSFRVDVNTIKNGVQSNNGYAGFTFNVWVDDVLYDQNAIDFGDNIEYQSKVRVKANAVTGYTSTFDQTSYVGAETLVFAPEWVANTYSIDYTLNNGSFASGTVHPTTATYDESFTVDNPKRTGYAFSGWNITGMDSVTHTYGSNTTTDTSISGTTETSYMNLRSTDGTVNYAATWNPKTYTLTYDNNGGSGCTKTTAKYDSTWNPSCVPTLANNVFNGWFTEATGGTQITTSTVVKGNATGIAQWSACTACSAGTGANCTLGVTDNKCTYSTSCKAGYNTISNNGKYNPSCKANTYTVAFKVTNGTKPSNGTVAFAGSKNFTSSPTSGYTYSSASCNNGASISRSGTTFTVSGVPSTVANGATITCTITYTDQTKPSTPTGLIVFFPEVTATKAGIYIRGQGSTDTIDGSNVTYQFKINNSWVTANSSSKDHQFVWNSSTKSTVYNITGVRAVDAAGNTSSALTVSRKLTIKRAYIWQCYTFLRSNTNQIISDQPSESEIDGWDSFTTSAPMVYNIMAISPEANTLYNSIGANAYAGRLFNAILGRSADSSGQTYVAGLGLTGGARYLANSDEAQNIYKAWGLGTGNA